MEAISTQTYYGLATNAWNPCTSLCCTFPGYFNCNSYCKSKYTTICNQYQYYGHGSYSGLTYLPYNTSSLLVTPSNQTCPFFSQQRQSESTLNVVDQSFIVSQDNLGVYSADGCWYPFSALRNSQNSNANLPSLQTNNKLSNNEIPESNHYRRLPIVGISQKGFRKKLNEKSMDIISGKRRFSNENVDIIYEKFHTPKLPSARPILLGQKPSKYSPGLEIVWNQHFGYLFSSYTDDVWEFGPLNPSKDSVTDCTVFRDMAKVRFCCRKCTHGWTSMHGPVMFYYRYEPYMRKGHVRFILTGQKCIECKSNDFETPMWYPEEAQKAMTNLYYEIASKVYGKATPPLIRDRRHGRPRQQHIATDCQGCHLGICKPMIEPKNT